jgi:hypothetical protein
MDLFFAHRIHICPNSNVECNEKVKLMQMHMLKISNVTPYIQELYLMTKINYKFSSNCTVCGCKEP